MIPGAGSGFSQGKYNNQKKAKKLRRQSYLRKVNERWRTEYEQYNENTNQNSSNTFKAYESEPSNPKLWKDDYESLKFSIHNSLLEKDKECDEHHDDHLYKSNNSADDVNSSKYTSEGNDRQASLFGPIIEAENGEETTMRNTGDKFIDSKERTNQVKFINEGIYRIKKNDSIQNSGSKGSQWHLQGSQGQSIELNSSANKSMKSVSYVPKQPLEEEKHGIIKKPRQASQQHVDIKAFRQKLKKVSNFLLIFKDKSIFPVRS